MTAREDYYARGYLSSYSLSRHKDSIEYDSRQSKKFFGEAEVTITYKDEGGDFKATFNVDEMTIYHTYSCPTPVIMMRPSTTYKGNYMVIQRLGAYVDRAKERLIDKKTKNLLGIEEFPVKKGETLIQAKKRLGIDDYKTLDVITVKGRKVLKVKR